MSYILDSLTNKDRKRQEERPIATLLPQGNRALKRNNKALIMTIVSAVVIALLVVMLIWLLWNRAPVKGQQISAVTDELTSSDELIRQLELVSSLQNSGNISVDSSASLIDSVPIESLDSSAPKLITAFKTKINTEVIDRTRVEAKTPNLPTKKDTPAKKRQTAGPKAAAPQGVTPTQNAQIAKVPSGETTNTNSIKGSLPPTSAAQNSTAISKTYPVDFKPPEVTALSYSGNPKKRFVMLDGVIYKEGDITLDDLNVVEIQKDRIVLEKNGQSFYYR